MSGGGRCWVRASLAALLLSRALPASTQDTHLLIVSGLAGEPAYADLMHTWSTGLMSAAEKRHAVARANIVNLAPKPERDPAAIDGASTREGIEKAMARIGERVRPGDVVFVVLFGHGSFLSGESRFNLPGPDLSDADFAKLLARLPEQKLVFVNTASASGEFAKTLAGPGRIVITSTKSGHERNQTQFGEHFVAAFTGDGADTDKDGRISALEAFDYARREVVRSYEKDKRLLTEHAVLDDDGDGKPSDAPGTKAGDGQAARSVFLAGPAVAHGAAEAGAAAADPALAGLLREKRELEDRIEGLKARKAQVDPAQYEKELEQLLVELALKTEEVRAASKAPRR